MNGDEKSPEATGSNVTLVGVSAAIAEIQRRNAPAQIILSQEKPVAADRNQRVVEGTQRP
jgi:hypothetical protein